MEDRCSRSLGGRVRHFPVLLGLTRQVWKIWPEGLNTFCWVRNRKNGTLGGLLDLEVRKPQV